MLPKGCQLLLDDNFLWIYGKISVLGPIIKIKFSDSIIKKNDEVKKCHFSSEHLINVHSKCTQSSSDDDFSTRYGP